MDQSIRFWWQSGSSNFLYYCEFAIPIDSQESKNKTTFPSYSWVLAKWLVVGWLVGGKTCVSVWLSALPLAISRQRVVRSTSSLACGKGPPGPIMCAVRSTVGLPAEARQRREYNPRA